MFTGSLTSIVNSSKHIKCVFLIIQKCMVQSALINLHLNECTPGLSYYPFVVNLDRRSEHFITLNDLSMFQTK